MANWTATGVGPDGVRHTDSVEAPTAAAAAAALGRRGILVHRLCPAPQAKAPRLPTSERAAFYGELSALLGARVPLAVALTTIAKGTDHSRLRSLAEQLCAAVEAGARLSDALQALTSNATDVGALAAGETRGNPADALARLAETLSRQDATERALLSALIYPAILLLVTLGSLATILLVVVPGLEPLLSAPGRDIPPSASAVLLASKALRTHGSTLSVFAVTVAGGLFLLRRHPAIRRWSEAAVIRLPLIGPAVIAADVATALRNAAGLVDSGTTVPSAFDHAAGAVRLSALADALRAIAEAVRQGEAIEASVASTALLPPGVAGLVTVGARTGTLSAMLLTAAARLERDAENRIARLLALLPPAITVLLGGLVGGITVVIFSAILSANDFAF